MHAQPHRYLTAQHQRINRRTTTALSVALSVLLVALLAALPTASASASPSAANATVAPSVSGLSSNQVEELLSGIPLGDLNATQLTEVLSQLPGLSALPAGKLQTALTKVIEGLTNKNATLGELLNPGEIVPTLESELKKLLSLQELLSFLKNEDLNTKLTAALETLDPSQLLGTVLGSTEHPEQLLTELFAALNPQTLETVLGGTLASQPFSKMTVGELAGEFGMTATKLTEELNTTTTEVPEAATALTAPLTSGKTLGVLNGLSGLTVGLLSPGSGEQGSGEGGSGGSGGGGSNSGGSGGTGGAGGSGGGSPGGTSPTSPSATTLLVNIPAQTASGSPSGTTSGNAVKKVGTIKILSHHVKGRTVTLVVQVPAAGTVSLGGKDVRSVREQVAKSERVTLHTTLTKAGVASRRKQRHGLRVKLKASFKIVGGSSSSAPVTVTFA